MEYAKYLLPKNLLADSLVNTMNILLGEFEKLDQGLNKTTQILEQMEGRLLLFSYENKLEGCL